MIKHDGIVIAVNGDGTVLVRIVQTSACAACKAKAMCASAESKEKEILAIGNGQLGIREEVIGTAALCAMGVYYIVLGFFKDKIQKDFSFTARKK